MGKGGYDEINGGGDTAVGQITFGVIAAQVVGLAMVVLSGVWMGSYRGGYGWAIETVFNYHPLFMTLGMIFLYGDAILIYRILRNSNKKQVKILHALIHILVLVFASIGLKAAFDSHNKKVPPIPNMYSMHSWVGLFAVILFGMQWVIGFISFLFPKLNDGLRRVYLPHHKFWGMAVFGLCCAAALMGLTEKAFFSLSPATTPYAKMPAEAWIINLFGTTIVAYALLVFYLVSKEEYARPHEN